MNAPVKFDPASLMTEDGYQSIPARTLMRECYAEYGSYVNQYRLIPNAGDGLISVYRRVLLAAAEYTKLTKTSAIVADTTRDWHPHGSASVDPVVSKLVRRGLLAGKGNHGVRLLTEIPPAATRYTEAGSIPAVRRALTELSRYAPHFHNEAHQMEPTFLITPIPLALVYGHIGIGLGCVTRIPAFTYASLLAAYRADDYRLLKPSYGYKMDEKASNLKELWEHGTGRVSMSMDLDYVYSKEDGCHISVISGSTELFTPPIGLFTPYQESGHVFVRNESSKVVRIVVGRTKGTRMISDDRIFEICQSAVRFTRKYDIRVNVAGQVKRVGIRDWMQMTMSLYTGAFAKWIEDEATVVRDKIFRHRITPTVIESLNAQKDDDAIFVDVQAFCAKHMTDDRAPTEEDVNKVTGRPIRLLRKIDFEAEIVKLEAELVEILGQSVEDSIDQVAAVLG